VEINFQGDVLTPMFLGGADPQGKPELRAPSVRGALRYWLRALAGGIRWANDGCDSENYLAKAEQEESNVFGSTDRRSTISVLVIPEEQQTFSQFNRDRAIRTPEGDFIPTGKDYLLWSLAESGHPDNPRHRPARTYIAPSSKFQIKLLASFRENENIKKAAATVWLLGNLGALGSRANRGAGSFHLMPMGNVPEAPGFKACASIDELQRYLCQGILQCKEVFAGKNADWRIFDGLPSYDILSPKNAEIWIAADGESGWRSHSEALNGIGEKLRDFRNHNHGIGKEDHDAVLRWLEKEGEGPNINRAVFGLPLPFRYSQGGAGDVIQSDISSGSRRSSPLKIRITRLTTGTYVGVLVLFKSRFLDEKAKLQLQTRKWKAPAPDDYTVICEFIKTFPVRRGVIYV